MLWYKTWRETRARFLIGAATLGWVCGVIVLLQHSARTYAGEPTTYGAYIWNAVYKDYVKNLFLVMTIVLGGGGLLQEAARGTAGFTLALPVSRMRLLLVRAAVGSAEVIGLALLPAVVIPLASPLGGESYPLVQALQFSILWAGCGLAVFGGALVLASLLADVYAAWIVSFLVLLFYGALVNLTALERLRGLDLFDLMSGSGMPYLTEGGRLLAGSFPWLPLSMILLLGIGFVLLAGVVTQRRDF